MNSLDGKRLTYITGYHLLFINRVCFSYSKILIKTKVLKYGYLTVRKANSVNK